MKICILVFIHLVFLANNTLVWALAPKDRIPSQQEIWEFQFPRVPFVTYGVFDLKVLQDSHGKVHIKVLEMGEGRHSNTNRHPSATSQNKNEIIQNLAEDLLSLGIPIVNYRHSGVSETFDNLIFKPEKDYPVVHYCTGLQELRQTLSRLQEQQKERGYFSEKLALVVLENDRRASPEFRQSVNETLDPFNVLVLGEGHREVLLIRDKFSTHSLFMQNPKLHDYRPTTGFYEPVWTPDLHLRIAQDLPSIERFVIKPRFEANAAGIVITDRQNLEVTLADILLGYERFQELYPFRNQKSNPYSVDYSKSYETWKKKSDLPSFIVEKLEDSNLVDGYNPTMRLSYRLFYDPNQPQEYQAKVLGCYWQMPNTKHENKQAGRYRDTPGDLMETYLLDYNIPMGKRVEKELEQEVSKQIEEILPIIYEQVAPQTLWENLQTSLKELSADSNDQMHHALIKRISIFLALYPNFKDYVWKELQEILLDNHEPWSRFLKVVFLKSDYFETLLKPTHDAEGNPSFKGYASFKRILAGEQWLFFQRELFSLLFAYYKEKASETEKKIIWQLFDNSKIRDKIPPRVESSQVISFLQQRQSRKIAHYKAYHLLKFGELKEEHLCAIWPHLFEEIASDDIQWLNIFEKFFGKNIQSFRRDEKKNRSNFYRFLSEHFGYIEKIILDNQWPFAKSFFSKQLLVFVHSTEKKSQDDPDYVDDEVLRKSLELIEKMGGLGDLAKKYWGGRFQETTGFRKTEAQLRLIFKTFSKKIPDWTKVYLTQHLFRNLSSDQDKPAFMVKLEKLAGGITMSDGQKLTSFIDFGGIMSQTAGRSA